MNKRVLLVGLLVILAIIWLFWPSTDSKTLKTFYYLPKQAEAEDTNREIHALAGHEPFLMEPELLRNYHRLCLSESMRPNGQQDQELRNAAMASAARFAAFNGIIAFMTAGYRECEVFIRALKNVVSSTSDTDSPIVRYIYAHPNDISVKTLAISSGDFLNHAVTSGLVSTSMTRGDYFVAKMMFLYRWAGLLGLTPPEARQFLPKECLQTIWGWVVERARDIPGAKRIAVLRLLERFEPDYPAGKVRLLLLLKNGNVDQAYKIWNIQTKNASSP